MLRKRYSFFQNACSWLLAVLIMCVPMMVTAQGLDAAQERNQLVRVYLSRLGVMDRMDVTLTAPYQLSTENGGNLYFQKDSEISFQIKNDAIYLYYRGMSQKLGNLVTLSRASENSNERTGFYLTNFPALYMGDLSLEIVEGRLRPILTIHVEDYLLGVVPYEMSDSFPLEALKAQAVAARTYALRNQNQYDAYDVVDTTNDQVFRGYIAGNERAEQAIIETRGVCGFYKGKLAQCYYSASNGGQMELVQTVWPTREDLGYYAFGEDHYDLENAESTVRSFGFAKQYRDETAPYALRKLIAEKLNAALLERGYDASPESIRVDRVNEVSVDSPNMHNSKRMTMLHLALEISVRTRQETAIHLVDGDMEEVSLFVAADLAPTDATFVPVVTLTPTATPEPFYGPFTAWHEPVLIDLPIFPDAEDVFGLDISSNYENEIWSVAEDDQHYTIEVRRYGHGVGMSQRGAQVMAGQYGMSYQDILAFYYPGMNLMQYPDQSRVFVKPDKALSATAGPAPSPTPRPTLMPATQTARDGQWFANVTEIADDSSLNLRSEPSMNGDILMRLYKGQRLLVLERCPEEGWVRVQTDVIEGYVMESYLTQENPS